MDDAVRDAPTKEDKPAAAGGARASTEGKDTTSEKREDWAETFVPTTPLAKALWELRLKLLAAGGGVWSAEENRSHIRKLRGVED